jgi:hypothetical protein
MLAARPSSVLLAARGGAARPRAVLPRRRTSVRVRAVLDVTTATWEKEVLKASRFLVVWGARRLGSHTPHECTRGDPTPSRRSPGLILIARARMRGVIGQGFLMRRIAACARAGALTSAPRGRALPLLFCAHGSPSSSSTPLSQQPSQSDLPVLVDFWA